MEDGVASTLSCGLCKSPIDYPPVKIPLHGWTVEKTSTGGLSIAKGQAPYGKFCLQCGRGLLLAYSENDLRRAEIPNIYAPKGKKRLILWIIRRLLKMI